MLDLATAEYSLVGCVLIDARCLPAALLRRHRAGQRRRSAAPPPGIRQDGDAPGGIGAPAVLRGRGQEPPRPHRHGRTGLVCPREPV